MAKAEKYRYSFKSHEGQTCVVRFEFEGFVGSSTTLVGAARPFVLKEFNTDDNIFKTLRPQMAEMSFIASETGVSIDDFLMDNDYDIIVYFDFGSWTNYWKGYMLQDEFQESWINTNHIITLRATEGIGQLKDFELTESGTELDGVYTPLELIKYAMEETVQDFGDYKVFSNLFHSSMIDTSTNTGLDQCYVDGRTFQISPSEYDDSYLTIEKINKSWNQTLYMYKGKWIIFRQEELYVPYTENIRGYRQNGLTRTDASQRFDALVGINETIKPISPEMLRFIQRRTKSDTIQFNYDVNNEIVKNGSFSRGSFISEIDFKKSYNVDNWKYQDVFLDIGAIPTSGTFTRLEEYISAEGPLFDNYVRFNITSSSLVGVSYIRSNNISILTGEKFDFNVDARFKLNFTDDSKAPSVYILFYGTSNNYFLKENGEWIQTNSDFTTNVQYLGVEFNRGSSPETTSWVTFSVNSQPAPEIGYINILLAGHNDQYVTNQERQFKTLRFTIFSVFGGQEYNNITGIKSIYTKNDDLKMTFDETIYMDDSFSENFKGSLIMSDGLTLTDKLWYRYRYSNEVFGFRKENDVAHWSHNRFNRNKIDANFYGLTWDGGDEPIGLVNTIRFTDDDPSKIYAIANLKEIDFSSSTWSATIVEVFDENKDLTGTSTYSFEGIAEPGIQNGVTYLPLDLIQGSQFTVTSNDGFTYNGSTLITFNISCTIEGEFNDISTLPYDAYIYLKKNGTTISSDFINVTSVPTSFNYDLSVSSITLNTGDTLRLQLANRIVEVDIIDSSLTFSYTSTGGITYDPYQDKYIYK